MFWKLKEALIQWLTREEIDRGLPLCDFERIRYEVRPSDVLLIEGRSRVSEVIKQVTQSPWTHSCLYIGRLHDIDDLRLREIVAQHYQGEPEEQLVIEGYLGKGTIVSPLENYRSCHIRICRPRGLARMDAQKIIAFAIKKIGVDYNVRQIFDLWRFLLPWSILPRRWRSSLFEMHNNQTARTVCSTMIAQAFGGINFPILPIVQTHEETGIELIQQNPKLITPKDFDYSPYFDIIKYPFMQFGGKGFYHHLPWQHTAHSNQSQQDSKDDSSSSSPTQGLWLPSDVSKAKRVIEFSQRVWHRTHSKELFDKLIKTFKRNDR